MGKKYHPYKIHVRNEIMIQKGKYPHPLNRFVLDLVWVLVGGAPMHAPQK